MPSASEAARALADDLLRPQAERVDVEGVPRSHLDAVARAGLYGPQPPPVAREVTELLAGADGSTWFVVTQHGLPLLQAGEAQHPSLPGLVDGSTPAGVAFAHVRRPGRPAVTVTRDGSGWRFDGAVDWTTGWGVVDLLLLGGTTDDGRLVFALLPAVDQPGLTTAPLQLAAMGGTRTVRLVLEGLRVDDAAVTLVADRGGWLAADALKTANVGPHTFGLLRETVRRLRATAERREDATAASLAERLDARTEELRGSAYVLLDDVAPAERLDERLALRATALQLAVTATSGLVTATGGSAMSLSAPPQRLAREALFHLVQAQTAPVRAATLRALAASVG
ncbi:MAG: acyl-CoA dehydrogenase [Frankiales bacterium]|nr:acyl-CoA dehydrogenase [Frankiales bacterium]